MAHILDMERGIRLLRGEDAWALWRDRLASTPFIPGTMHRAPAWDPRHAAPGAGAPPVALLSAPRP